MKRFFGIGLTLLILSFSFYMPAAFAQSEAAETPAAQSSPALRAEYELVGVGNIVYRLNKVSGRVDILYPGDDGAYLIPVWQMNPGLDPATGKMTEEEQKRWIEMSKKLAQYMKPSA